MSFQKRFNQLCDWLAVTNADLARRAEVDPSLISRLRSGKRHLRADSPVIRALAAALVDVAAEQERLGQLLQRFGVGSGRPRPDTRPDVRPDTRPDASASCCLEAWLTDGAADLLPPRTNGRAKTRQPGDFASKLDRLIRALDLTNAQIAAALHVDPSLVSLYRSGRRIPSEDNWFLQSLLEYLARRIQELPPECLAHERQVLGLGPNADLASIQRALENWLMAPDPDTGSASAAAQRFLARLESCESLPPLSPKMQQLVHSLPSPPSRSVHHVGMAGLQTAARDLLLQAVLSDSPKTLLLYSDHGIGWLTDDPEYTQLWQLLMYMVLQQGHRIEIIHRVDRERDEIQEGIETWLPIYMTGQLRSWTLEGASGCSFRHTRFILPGLCAITATSIAGDEENTIFEYTTVQKQMDYLEHEFELLLRRARPLLRAEKIDSAAAVDSFLQQLPAPGSESRHLHSGLPFACLDAADLEVLLTHESLSERQREVSRLLHEVMVRRFTCDQASGVRSDSIVLASAAAVAAREVRLTLPFGAVPCPPEIYRRHLARVEKFCREYPDWSLSIRPSAVLSSMTISIWADGTALFTRAGETPLGMLLNNERLYRGLQAFANQQAEKRAGHCRDALAELERLGAELGLTGGELEQTGDELELTGGELGLTDGEE
ncbi:MAG: hypothetical protein QM296_10545 [Bacillota bacterium]|nr:hypothetical protein [Bacillota bacterium]